VTSAVAFYGDSCGKILGNQEEERWRFRFGLEDAGDSGAFATEDCRFVRTQAAGFVRTQDADVHPGD
jgi:hypothetical protein